MQLNDHIMPVNACLKCGYTMDRATGPTTPKPDDVTVCLECGHVMAFDNDLKFRSLTDDELIAIATDPRVDAIVALIKGRKR